MARVVLSVLLFLSSGVFACECFPFSLTEEYESAAFVGVVRIDANHQSPGLSGVDHEVIGHVERSWKGLSTGDLRFVSHNSMCSPFLEPSGRYLLFLRPYDDVLTLDACGADLAFRRWFPSRTQRDVMRFLRNVDGT